jgi:hypothetical protein
VCHVFCFSLITNQEKFGANINALKPMEVASLQISVIGFTLKS